MKLVKLGKTGIEVSQVSFGTVSLGIPYGIGVTGKDAMLSEAAAVSLLQRSLEKGINFFDTARSYGCSEERLGKAFRDRRSDVVVCTKCARLHDDKGSLPHGRALKTIMDRSIAESLSALQTDYVDIYMIHDAGLNVIDNPAVVELLTQYKNAGLVRALGITTYTVDETRAAIESGAWDMIQLPYNLMDQRQKRCFALAQERGIGIVVRSVLLKGVLTDRGRNLHPALQPVEQHRSRYNELISGQSSTLSDLATRFVLSQEGVSSALLGIDREEFLDQALAVADGHRLDDATRRRAEELAYPDPDFINLPQWDRRGWLT